MPPQNWDVNDIKRGMEVSERGEQAFWKTSIHTRDKVREMATNKMAASTTELTLFHHPICSAQLVRSSFIKMRLALLRFASLRSAKVPKSQLELERVYGCLGKTICPNLYETYEGKVVFTAAAVAVVQHVESGAQRFYNNHTDDITCISIHYAGKLVVTGQLGKPCYCLVWSLETFETLFRIGDGYFERMVQAAAISPNERYLCGVGGDNSQSVGIFDLKAIDEATGQPR